VNQSRLYGSLSTRFGINRSSSMIDGTSDRFGILSIAL
jgi:hypothetical protein